MDLFGGYLLVALVLFSINFALIMGNFQLSNVRAILFSAILFGASFALMMIPQSFNNPDFLLGIFGYVFLIVAVVIFAIMLLYLRKNDIKTTVCSLVVLFVVLTVALASQSELLFFDSLIYSLLCSVCLFIVYQFTKLLVHAKRRYPIIVGEYMSLFSILMLIFALTYDSTLNLDYNMFKPFLILTPTYQLIYLLVGICVVMVLGVLLNDVKGGTK